MRRCIYALLLALAWLQSATAQADNVYTGPCDATLYRNWYDQKYDGVLQSTPQFWIFSNAPLSNGLAMEKAAVQCHTRLNQLRLDRAGRHGPVEDWWIYDMMYVHSSQTVHLLSICTKLALALASTVTSKRA
jgi:hypothetical protein